MLHFTAGFLGIIALGTLDCACEDRKAGKLTSLLSFAIAAGIGGLALFMGTH